MSTFTKATRQRRFLRMALAGPAGSGKSFTALTLAQGLGARIALIDTEHGGAGYYADDFAFDTLELTTFHPQQYIDALQAAAQEGYDVAIVDSLSQAWNGKDGALELVDRAAKRSDSRNSFAAWREVTPLHNQLVETMLSVPLHVIVTLRSKMEYVVETDSKGKQAPKKVGMAPIQREGLEYEFDLFAEMDRDHTLVVTKSRLRELADAVIDRPGEAFAATLSQALQAGTVREPQPDELRRTIQTAMRDILHPLHHAGLCQAVVQRSFACGWTQVAQQDDATLRTGYGLFHHLCTQLARHGIPETIPDVWIDAEVRQLSTDHAADVAA